MARASGVPANSSDERQQGDGQCGEDQESISERTGLDAMSLSDHSPLFLSCYLA